MCTKSRMLTVLTDGVGELPATLTLFAVRLINGNAKTLNITLEFSFAVCNFNSGSDENFRKRLEFGFKEVCKFTVCIKSNLSLKRLTDNLFVSCKFKSLLNIGSYLVNSVPLCDKCFISLDIIRSRNISILGVFANSAGDLKLWYSRIGVRISVRASSTLYNTV